MYLKKLYCTGKVAFKEINFINGINFVYGYREDKLRTDKTKDSLNNIGKSTFLDIIDFALGADFTEAVLPRLWVAWQLKKLTKTNINLIFEVSDKEYTIRRSFDDPRIVIFGQNNKVEELGLEPFRGKMGELVFGRDDYEGNFDPFWFRSLLAFYVHILSPNKKDYPDPIKYIDYQSHAALMQYHLYLLNIDNLIFSTINSLFKEQTALKRSITQIKLSIQRTVGIGSIEKIKHHISKLNSDIYKLNEDLEEYHLSKNQAISSEEASKYSKEINDLAYDIFQYKQKLDIYAESLKKVSPLSLNRIEDLYNEINTSFGSQVTHTLEEAFSFRKRIVSSRKYFLKSEMNRLLTLIIEKEQEMSRLDKERAIIFRQLSSSSALVNIKDAYSKLLEKRTIVSELEGKLQVISELEERLSIIKRNIADIQSQFSKFKDSIKTEELNIRSIYDSLYSSLFELPDDVNTFFFDIKQLSNSVKFDIKVFEHHEILGKSRNRVRVMLYNLTVLLYSIQKGYNAPRFLIHDSVMDGVDKANYNDLIKLFHKAPFTNLKFQYIITLNEEGSLSGKWGDTLFTQHEQILKEAIVKLTPKRKFLGEFSK